MEYTGSCHCGAVEFSLNGDLSSALKCTCSICKRKGTPMVAADEGSFKPIKGEELLSSYTFGSGIAEHFFCSKCGIYTHHRTRRNPKAFRVNAGCLEGVDPLEIQAQVFDGASLLD